MRPFFFISFLLLFNIVFSQENPTPVLEREITLSSDNASLEMVLNNISQQANFIFSYSPDVIHHIEHVNIHVRNKSVRFVLNQILKDNSVDYKVKGKYIILKKKNKEEKVEEESRIFEGYVYDSKTGEKLTEASVYDKTLMASAITDKYGYFSMEVPSNKPISSLQISKVGYSDTMLISLDSAQRYKNLEIILKQNDSLPKRQPLVDFLKIKPGWLVPEKLKINAKNISQPIFRSFQLSLIPYLSTNRLLGGVAVNDFSINTTVGYVHGVKIFEAGGLLNFVRTDVSFFEAAGIGNIVGGNVRGFQAAGVFNVVHNVNGFQAAGIFNQVNEVKGMQVAGIYNFAVDTSPIQFAGIFNKATKNIIQISGIFNTATTNNIQTAGLFNNSQTSNVQLAGLLNNTHKADLQIAGLLNNTDVLTGAQIAGFSNVARKAGAFQLAGAMNIGREDADVQISGLLNHARYVKKFQLALINIADSSDGVSIGLLSFIKKGYHKLEFSADETFPVNIAFRTGVKKFHTFLIAGARGNNTDNLLWNFGYGLGTSFGNPNKTLFDIDFSSQEVMFKDNFDATNHLYKIYLGLDRKITRKMSIAAGISYNALLSDSNEPVYNDINSRIPFYTLNNTTYSNGHNLKTWIGGKIALRFF